MLAKRWYYTQQCINISKIKVRGESEKLLISYMQWIVNDCMNVGQNEIKI